MLKCKIKKGSRIRVESKGTCDDLVAETGVLIQEIYRGIKREHPGVAEKYRLSVIGLLLDPNSPVWSDQGVDHA